MLGTTQTVYDRTQRRRLNDFTPCANGSPLGGGVVCTRLEMFHKQMFDDFGRHQRTICSHPDNDIDTEVITGAYIARNHIVWITFPKFGAATADIVGQLTIFFRRRRCQNYPIDNFHTQTLVQTALDRRHAGNRQDSLLGESRGFQTARHDGGDACGREVLIPRGSAQPQ